MKIKVHVLAKRVVESQLIVTAEINVNGSVHEKDFFMDKDFNNNDITQFIVGYLKKDKRITEIPDFEVIV